MSGCGYILFVLNMCYAIFVFQSVLGKDGAVLGVTVTRMSMALHSQTLTQACDYSEGMGLGFD
jgi:hypothetical protein